MVPPKLHFNATLTVRSLAIPIHFVASISPNSISLFVDVATIMF
ncbi:hypothetical protein [Fructilactobacillus florum]|nr:hypothetical protein [Fructilactobacillus florum]